MVFRLHITAHVDEVRETRRGRLVSDTERGYWLCTREITLPFEPYVDLEIFLDDTPADHPLDQCRLMVERLGWEVAQNRFVAVCDWNRVFPHESTPEALVVMHPGWSFRWVDEHAIDDSGRLKPERE